MLDPVKFSEIPELVGQVVEGDVFSVSQEDVDGFEKATWVTDAYVNPDPPEFPENILEGFFSLSLIDALSTRMLPFDYETCWGLNYGLDRVRFVSTLKIGEPIVPRFECLEVKEKSGGFLVLRRCTFTAEGAGRPGMVADWWMYIQQRGSGA